MSAEDEIRAAFSDLDHRARRAVDARAGLARLAGPRRWAFTPAVLAALAVFVLVGGFALLRLLPGEMVEPPPVIDAPSASTAPDTAETQPGDTSTVSEPTVGPSTTVGSTTTTVPASSDDITELHRVDTRAVAADVSDPFLNVRSDPDPEADIVARLAPTYAGVRFAGETATPSGGGVWWLVELVDPLTVQSPAADGSAPTGWVNAAFLEPLPHGLAVTTEEVPPCESEGGVAASSGAGGSESAVFSLRAAEVADGCLRIVLGFGSAPGSDEIVPADAVPTVQELQSNGPLMINLPGTRAVWAGATEVPGGFVVREADGSLSLVVTTANQGVSSTALPERGLLVVDLSVTGTEPPPGDGRVTFTSDPVVGPGRVEAQGLSRPFEANLGVSVLDDSGAPVEAVFSGSDFLGTVSASEYGVTTTDWMEAWGRFAVRVDGLEPGDYTLVLDPLGGEDQPATFGYDFTIDEAGDGAEPPSPRGNDVALGMVRFARGGDPSDAALADEVTLGVGDDLIEGRAGSALRDRSAWAVDTESGTFAERGGPFDALDLLASSASFRVSEGSVPSCASAPRAWPALEHLAQVTIEPIGIDSCIEWFGVSLFLDADGRIEAVVLDIGSP